ncbi:PLP-dependent aminotransferase family protein [Acetobacter sacchari]|uniref:PLP-dependent aminotransferase family protein n=1 Tax=Acetobacter sacchari TaxID=2661687 RepID=A0ABS3M0W8_9PROT|nr:PLP-dependent aminotransferase family protein [Acetobacter sacchari]MBO1361832.1 PLP-dependent aminotransferase family protein [Acetobacter sacchari]
MATLDLPQGWIQPDRAQGDLEGQIYRAMRDAILDQRLPAGARLPSTRRMADACEVSRSTVVQAYDRLHGEGYVVSRSGAASVVATLPDLTFFGRALAGDATPPRRDDSSLNDAPPKGGIVARLDKLRTGEPDVTEFPHAPWARCLGARARSLIVHDLSYDEPEGLAILRRAVLDHARQYRGVLADLSQVVIVPSTRIAISLLAEAALRPAEPDGRVTWFENPGYVAARDILVARGADLVPVACDAQGVACETAGLPRPRLIYVTPSHQYPTGVTMSLTRRLALLDRARRSDAVIIEDDYDSEFQYDGRPIAALQGMDRHETVAYCGTMAKVLAPGMRVAYAILPRRYVDPVRSMMRERGLSVPAHVQAALADFIRDGHLRGHIRRMTRLYAERMNLAVEELSRRLGNSIELGPGTGGLQLLLRFRDPTIDDFVLQNRLQAAGFGARALSPMCLTSSGGAPSRGILIGVARATRPDLEKLSHVIRRGAIG